MFAKVNGNYENIEGGTPEEGVEFLTGFPCSAFFFIGKHVSPAVEDVEKSWTHITENFA